MYFCCTNVTLEVLYHVSQYSWKLLPVMLCHADSIIHVFNATSNLLDCANILEAGAFPYTTFPLVIVYGDGACESLSGRHMYSVFDSKIFFPLPGALLFPHWQGQYVVSGNICSAKVFPLLWNLDVRKWMKILTSSRSNKNFLRKSDNIS